MAATLDTKLHTVTKAAEWLTKALLIGACLSSWAVRAEPVLGFQKVSALQGGLTESGVDLDTRDDLGESVTVIGDLDGDGVVDVAVGARRDDDGGVDRGAVYVLFMNTDGTVKRSQKISDTEGGFTGTLDNFDFFGIGVSGIGDLDGDGVLDIAVGANGDDEGASNAGAIYILFLNVDGTVRNHQKISRLQGGLSAIVTQFGRGTQFLGDYNNDGFVDMYVSPTGSTFLILTLNSDGTVRSETSAVQAGGSAAVIGDLDQDGIMDLVIGSQGNDDGFTNAGAAFVLFMNADGSIRQRQRISLLEGGFTGLLEEGDQFGQSVAGPGDLNRDGIPDLVVGAEAADSLDGVQNNTGELWLVFLNRDGTVQSQIPINGESENFQDIRFNSNLGQEVTAPGDLNGDGFPDVIATADGDVDGAGVMTGAFYVIFLNGFNPPPETRFQQSQGSGNLLVIEAENFNRNVARGSHSWSLTDDNAASNGAAMVTAPNIGTSLSENYALNSPQMDYQVNFATAGTHYLWVRGFADNGNDNSIHFGLNGQEITTARRITDLDFGSFAWANQRRDGSLVVVTIDVPSAGPHTINAWMREDGFVFDRFLLTTDASFIPTGFGPAESGSVAIGSTAPEIESIADQTTAVNDFVSLQVEASDADGDSLSYTASGLPTGLSIDTATGLISGFPTTIADFSVVIVVTDATGAVSSETFDWVIITDNTAPVIATIGDREVIADQLLSFTVSASDADGPGPLVLEVLNLPPGASFSDAGNGTGEFSWVPTTGDAISSPFDLTFRATDDGGNGLSASRSISIEVSTPGGTELRFLQSSGAGNLLVVEAENASANVERGSHRWQSASRGGAGGGTIMEALPNVRVNNATDYADTSPRLDYDVTFVATGTHYVWVRGFSPNSGADSVHVGLDGVDLLSSRRLDSFALNTLDWSGDVQIAPGQLVRATIDVGTAGAHTLNIWMREDGFGVDRLLITTDPNFVPTGQGPSESLLELVGDGPGGDNNAPTITGPADQSTEVNASVSLQVNASDADGDALTYTATGLPTGLTIDPTTGLISGSPTTAANFNPSLTVSDGFGGSATANFAWSVTASGGVARFIQSNGAGNFLVVEAENFSVNTAQGVHSWEPNSGGGAAAGVSMLATPNIRTNNATNYSADSPRLDYEVSFVTTGTHYVWVRGFGANTGNDSVHVGLDGVDLLSSRRLDDFVTGSFDWSGDIQVAPGQLQRATIEVTTPGDHTLNIWMREDGFQVDRLFLTTDPTFVPTGTGPVESPR